MQDNQPQSPPNKPGALPVKAPKVRGIPPIEGILIPSEGFIRIRALKVLYPVSNTTLWKRIKDGQFPKPYSLGERMVAWDVVEVRKALDAMKLEERSTPSPAVKMAQEALAKKRKTRKYQVQELGELVEELRGLVEKQGLPNSAPGVQGGGL